jgi:hypothetical protein
MIITFMLALLFILPASCSDTETTANEKISSLLLTQVNLKKEQIDKPTDERLNTMRQMGMMVDNLDKQRIFIHLERELDDSQVKELENMGLTLYLDSWIPPVGAHPTGFILADMPINVLEELAEVDYIVRLDTAEQQLQPQAVNQPKGG